MITQELGEKAMIESEIKGSDVGWSSTCINLFQFPSSRSQAGTEIYI